MRPLCYKFGMVLWLCFVSISVSYAQQGQGQDQNQNSGQDQSTEPIPAYRSPLASGADNGDIEGQSTNPEDFQPDTTSLSGAENLSVGSPEGQRSYWQPHVGLNVTANSGGVTSGGSGWTTWASFYGGVDLHRYSGHSNLTLTYSAGGVVSNDQDTSNGVTQGLSFADRYTFRRETISVIDQVSYLPAASAGLGVGGGFGGVSLPGVGSPGLTYPFAPGQTILSTTGQILSDSSLLESDTTLSARSSISLVGGYMTQVYFDNSLLNSYGYDFKGGYNYQLTPKDTLALSYLFTAFRYSNFGQSIDSHAAQFSYSRRVTGRLAFQIGGGPEISFFNIPISANAPTQGTGSGSGELYWTLNTALQYRADRTGLSVGYYHGVTSGAGVLAGSVTDSVSATATHQLTRTVGGSFNFGYARNNGVGVTTPALEDQTYDYWFGGATLSRPLGHTMTASLSYQFQYQTSTSSFCAGPACSTNYTRHLITLGFDWHARPRAF